MGRKIWKNSTYFIQIIMVFILTLTFWSPFSLSLPLPLSTDLFINIYFFYFFCLFLTVHSFTYLFYLFLFIFPRLLYISIFIDSYSLSLSLSFFAMFLLFFLEDISLKVTVIVLLEFEPLFFKTAVQYFSSYATPQTQLLFFFPGHFISVYLFLLNFFLHYFADFSLISTLYFHTTLIYLFLFSLSFSLSLSLSL